MIPAGTSSGECRGCHAPILWASTEAGRLMPLDADEAGDDGTVTVERGVAQVVPSGPTLFPVARYRPHWATCPHADRFRPETTP